MAEALEEVGGKAGREKLFWWLGGQLRKLSGKWASGWASVQVGGKAGMSGSH